MKTCEHLFDDTTKRYLKTKTDETKQTKRETATADRTGNYYYYYHYYQTYFDTVTNQPLPYLAYYLHIYKVKLKWLLFIRPCIIKNIKNYKN